MGPIWSVRADTSAIRRLLQNKQNNRILRQYIVVFVIAVGAKLVWRVYNFSLKSSIFLSFIAPKLLTYITNQDPDKCSVSSLYWILHGCHLTYKFYLDVFISLPLTQGV